MRAGRTVASRYRITQEIGRGGMGVVWLAPDEVLGREVAVKETTFGPQVTPTERAPLCECTVREARAAGRVDHPAVTRVHDVVEQRPTPGQARVAFQGVLHAPTAAARCSARHCAAAAAGGRRDLAGPEGGQLLGG